MAHVNNIEKMEFKDLCSEPESLEMDECRELDSVEIDECTMELLLIAHIKKVPDETT